MKRELVKIYYGQNRLEITRNFERAAVHRYRYKVSNLDPNTHEVKAVLHGSGDTLELIVEIALPYLKS